MLAKNYGGIIKASNVECSLHPNDFIIFALISIAQFMFSSRSHPDIRTLFCFALGKGRGETKPDTVTFLPK